MEKAFALGQKTILVTGASSGIGRSIAHECSKAGANMVINGRDEVRLGETFDSLIGNGHKQIIGDLTVLVDIDRIVSEMPSLDGIVLCAGVTQNTPIKNTSIEKTEKIFQTNTLSSFSILQKLLKAKKINKNASIVLISSIAQRKPYVGNAIYSASKAAVSSFAKVAALELSNRGIRVNCIEPGIIPTHMVTDSVISEEQWKEQEKTMPLGFGKPEYIANGCIYLLSDASCWVTGVNLKIDGGQTLL